MIQTSYSRTPGTLLVEAAMLEELADAPATQAFVEELALGMGTHPGSKRNRNEDRIAVARITAPNGETYTAAIVCDGVGGSEAGDQAATLAIVSIFINLAQQQGSPLLNELAADVIRRADDHVRTQLKGRGATTLVMLLGTASGHMVCANVGDSRAYSWDPTSSKLNQVTTDDTIENELRALPGNPEALIKAHGLRGRLSQALGEGGRTADELRIQTYAKEYFRHGAVLGSDGLWRVAKDFNAAVANATTPTDAIRRAIALASWVGGVDNASMIAMSDVERLCSGQQGQQLGITLWTSSTKVKLFTKNWVGEGKAPQGRAKPERPKRNSKKKDPRNPMDEPQLRLESIEFKEPRPKLEVTIADDSKKS